MQKKYYLPHRDSERVTWLNNFATKLTTYATLLGISAAELAVIVAWAAFYAFVIGIQQQLKDFKQDFTKYKNRLSSAPLNTPLDPLPQLAFTYATLPANAGIFTYISGLVMRIKGNTAYTEAIGEDLGIIGDEQSENPDVKPDLTATLDAGRPHLKSHKHHTDGFNLYADYGDGKGMHYIANVTLGSGFIDGTRTIVNADSAVYKYQAVHVLDDHEVGKPSDIVSITVTKLPGA